MRWTPRSSDLLAEAATTRPPRRVAFRLAVTGLLGGLLPTCARMVRSGQAGAGVVDAELVVIGTDTMLDDHDGAGLGTT